ncbi:hypothetical protein SLEP1_g27916 [Rubroshorea leprosula]|uniref:Uncharacterized protein n=1 Tax=Rubroshorea leprosula TaxID=152421 RepID=A0AAV5JYE2_9ROSI|nr:hypothetical protein SLEP1_g27916 [Rubroshorea leprosula]
MDVNNIVSSYMKLRGLTSLFRFLGGSSLLFDWLLSFILDLSSIHTSHSL